MLYNEIEIILQRDSKLQVGDGRFQTVSIIDIEAGDLVFFGKSEQKISHLGIYLGNGQFIHSTIKKCRPWIRISNLSDLEWSGHKEANFLYRIGKQWYYVLDLLL